MKFTEEQISFMKSIGIEIHFINPSDNEIIDLTEKISDHLQINGFDEKYKPTKDGLMCESILDTIAEME